MFIGLQVLQEVQFKNILCFIATIKKNICLQVYRFYKRYSLKIFYVSLQLLKKLQVLQELQKLQVLQELQFKNILCFITKKLQVLQELQNMKNYMFTGFIGFTKITGFARGTV